jgi:rhodanese-related sulfurtransferase
MSIQVISPEEVHARRSVDGAALLIDVRTPMEYARVHADGAKLVPLDTLDPAEISKLADGHPVFLICKSGARATKAVERCVAAGLKDVFVVAGGTSAWEVADLPVVRGPSVMSLERQVRIAAGSLVLVSIILGWHVHPVFLLLGLFVGGGLVFSGVTDTCGMAMLLAKMPWNRVKLPPDATPTSQTAVAPSA